MATLNRQNVVGTGLNPTFAAASAGGDKCPPGDSTFLYVKNGHTAAQTVTIDSVTPSSYGTDVDLVVSVPNAGERAIGPLPASRYAGTDGLVSITYSGVTALTVACITAG